MNCLLLKKPFYYSIRWLLGSLWLVLLPLLGWGQGSETFTNLNSSPTSSYLNGNYNGDGTPAVVWNYTSSRSDQTITGKAITLQNGTGSVSNTAVSGGLASISFNFKKPFTGDASISGTVAVNGTSIGTFSTSGTTVSSFSISGKTITGNIVISIASTSGRITIDDIVWTGYAGSATPASPTLTTTSPATSITQDGATLAGNISSFGSPAGTTPAYGFVYSLTSANATPTLGNGTTITTGTTATTGNYSSVLTGLAANSQYSFQAYATNGNGTSYGGVATFTTLAVAVPTVTTATPGTFTSTGATLGGSITAANGDTPTEYGVVYSTSNNPPTTADTKVAMTNGPATFSQAVALAAGTYYVRAYALNSAGTGYGAVATLVVNPAPTITSLSPNPVNAGSGAQTLTINGTGFVSASATTATYNGSAKPVTFVSATQLTISLTAVNVATVGSYPVVVTNAVPGGGAATATLVVTQAAPSITTTAASAITSASATSGGNVTSAGGGTITARGVVYSTSNTPRIGGAGTTQIADASPNTGSYTSSITGLAPSTMYYVAAYATNSMGTTYGNDQSFTTSAAPTIATGAVSPTSVAAGNSLTVVYNTTGTFGVGNTFAAELSDFTGAFPGVALTTTASSTGSLTVTIPSTPPPGSAYRVRVVASSPAITGSLSGAFTITGPPLVSYSTVGLTSSAVAIPVSTTAPNITATTVTRGPGVTQPNSITAGTFGGSDFTIATTLNPASDDYFAFNITTAAGYTTAITNVIINTYRSNAGPGKADLLYSTDGTTWTSTNTLGSITLPNPNATSFTFAPTGTALQSVAGTLYFRLYGYNGSTGIFYLTDNNGIKAVVVNGSTTATPASLTASPTSLSFTAVNGQAAPTQTYTLTGLNLAANASVAIGSSDAAVLVSLTGAAPFSQTATATASASGSLSQTVTVLYTAPATSGTTSATISNTVGSLSAPVAVAATSTTSTPVPTITNFTPSSGPTGTAVTIVGTGLTGATSVLFNGTAATLYTINSAGTQLTATVPASATTGLITIATPGGTATSSTSFTVIQSSPAGLLLLEENFDYPSGTVLTQTASTGWQQQDPTNNTAPFATTSAGNLSRYSYPQGAAFATVSPVTSTQANLSGGASAEDIYKVFPSQQASGATLYAAALVTLSAIQSTGDYFLSFYNANAPGSPLYLGRVFAKAATGGYQLGVTVNGNVNSAVYSSTVLSLGTTYVVVLKYDNTSGTDAASLFVFDNSSTTMLPALEPTTPSAGPVTSSVNSLALLNSVQLRQPGSNSYATLTLDNLRVANGWGSVIGQPVFTSSTATVSAGSYYSLRVAGTTARATTSGPVAIEKVLDLDGGVLTTTATNPVRLRYRAPSTPADDFQILVANGSYVDGPVSREVAANVGLSQLFPIGRSGNYRPLTLNIDIAPSVATLYTASQTEGPSADQTINSPLTRISQARYFTLTPSPIPAAGSFSGNVELSFGSNDGVTDPSSSNFVVAKNSNDGTHWTNFNRQSNSSSTLKSGSFQSFSDFILASTDPATTPNPLPVTLTSFAATRAAAGVQVAWATASEKNSDYFEVQRALDGSTFASVAKVAAHGTTTQSHTYASLDATAPAALLYYRLRQVDLDGTVAYSPVVSVAAADGATAEVTLAPNPAHDRIGFLTAQPTAYSVRNTLGQLVRSGTTVAGPNNLLVDELPAGVYFFELHSSAGRTVRKFVKE